MRTSDDLAGIFYTGGTTGRSKGVMLSHGNLMANALNALGEGLLPDRHGLSSRRADVPPRQRRGDVFAAARAAAPTSSSAHLRPEGVMAAVQNDRVTDVLLVPTMIQMLVDHPALGDATTCRR